MLWILARARVDELALVSGQRRVRLSGTTRATASYNAPRARLPGSTPSDESTREITMRPNPVKRALKAGEPSVGTWLSLGSITAARFMARTGLNWLTVDIDDSRVEWEK